MVEKAETNVNVEFEVDYRDIIYPRLEYKTGNLRLILPKNYENATTLLQKYKKWITKKEITISAALEEAKEKRIDMKRTKIEFQDLVFSIVKKYEEEFSFKINKIFLKKMKTKWGSYTSKGNLTINTLLKYLPEGIIKYVIFHEMAHSIERKHNKRFWKIVNQKFNDSQTKENDLLVHWFLVQRMVSN